MSEMLRVGIIQMTSGPEIGSNVVMVEKLIRQAAAGGARLIVTPENTCHIRGRMADKFDTVPNEEDHPILTLAEQLSRVLNVYILIGSVSVRGAGGKLWNRSYLYRAGHNAPVTYDKIHLFDADLSCGQSYRESDVFQGGDQVVLVDVDGFKLGMTICYDIRFPALYRALAKAGADVIAVPAAFAVPTGEAHWHTLLRARAIENGVYVLAPAQVGEHTPGRRTYGHSMIVDPWGMVIAEMNEPRAGVLYADLDLSVVRRTRSSLQSLRHDRDFTVQYVE